MRLAARDPVVVMLSAAAPYHLSEKLVTRSRRPRERHTNTVSLPAARSGGRVRMSRVLGPLP